MGNDHQGLVVDEETGANIAVAYEKKNAPLLAAGPKFLAALREIAERGPVDGYNSIISLRLRLVATQSIARAAIQELGLQKCDQCGDDFVSDYGHKFYCPDCANILEINREQFAKAKGHP